MSIFWTRTLKTSNGVVDPDFLMMEELEMETPRVGDNISAWGGVEELAAGSMAMGTAAPCWAVEGLPPQEGFNVAGSIPLSATHHGQKKWLFTHRHYRSKIRF